MAHSTPKLLRVCKDSGWSQNREPPQRLCPKFDLDKAGSLSTLKGILGDKRRAKIVYFRTTTYKPSAIGGLFVSSEKRSGDGTVAEEMYGRVDCVSLKQFEFCPQPFPARQTRQPM